MSQRVPTEQESFWQGNFGDAYVDRNCGQPLLASNLAFFSRALQQVQGLGSVIELGANIGLNLQALGLLLPAVRRVGVEINAKAHRTLAQLPGIEAHLGSLLDVATDEQFDLALIKGVLIHQHPEMLPQAYAKLHALSARYVLIAEYYNPTPVEVVYRGEHGKLFKRDFAGEMLDRYPDLMLRDYGFIYHRDHLFPQDDMNWFLLEKRQ